MKPTLALLAALVSPAVVADPTVCTETETGMDCVRSHPDVVAICGEGWHVARNDANDSLGFCLPNAQGESMTDTGSPMARSKVVEMRLRCTMTNIYPDWPTHSSGGQEFILDCKDTEQ